MRFELRWATAEYSTLPIGRPLDVNRVSGMTDVEIQDASAAFPSEATITAEVSSQGKGASAPGVAIVVELERFGTDVASLIAIGSALFAIIACVKRRFKREPVVEDPTTLGALAAASARHDLTGMRYVGTVPITAYPGIGTDRRDIWAACFEGSEEEGTATLLFVSPAGTSLGLVSVPSEMFLTDEGWQTRSTEDIRQWWQER